MGRIMFQRLRIAGRVLSGNLPKIQVLVRLPVRLEQFTHIGTAASVVEDVDAGRDVVLGCVGEGGGVTGPGLGGLEVVGAGGGVEGVCHGMVGFEGVDGTLTWR